MCGFTRTEIESIDHFQMRRRNGARHKMNKAAAMKIVNISISSSLFIAALARAVPGYRAAVSVYRGLTRVTSSRTLGVETQNESVYRSIGDCFPSRRRSCAKQSFTWYISWSKNRISVQGNEAQISKEIDAELHKIKDKAYQDALKRIPDSNEAHDPWKGAR